MRFFYVPVQAREPQPATAATGVALDATLTWRPGREAASHKVFFGTDQAAVAGGTAAGQTVTDHGFRPGALNFGTTYYWKVDEINAVTPAGQRLELHHPGVRGRGGLRELQRRAATAVFTTWIDG